MHESTLEKIIDSSPAIVGLERYLAAEEETKEERIKVVSRFLLVIRDIFQRYINAREAHRKTVLSNKARIIFMATAYELQWNIEKETLTIRYDDLSGVPAWESKPLLIDEKLTRDSILENLSVLRTIVERPIDGFRYL